MDDASTSKKAIITEVKEGTDLAVFLFFPFSFKSSPNDMFFLLISEHEEGIERNIDVREKHRSATSSMHPRLNPQLFGAWDDAPTN